MIGATRIKGAYRCSHCNLKVKGKSTPKVHSGKTVTKNAVAATCTQFGYSGDVYVPLVAVVLHFS